MVLSDATDYNAIACTNYWGGMAEDETRINWMGWLHNCQNPNSTQPNITLVGLDMKMTLHTTPQKLNVSNISAVTGLILIKL